MGWIAQKKYKKNKKKRKEGLKEEDRRDQAGERLIFFIQRTSDNGEQSQHQRTVTTSENSLKTPENIR